MLKSNLKKAILIFFSRVEIVLVEDSFNLIIFFQYVKVKLYRDGFQFILK